MRTVSPGQPFSMSADEFNSFQQAAQFVRAERTRRGASSGIGNATDRTCPMVVSMVDEAIRAFSAVKITGIQEKPGGGPTDDFIGLTPLLVAKPTSASDSFLILQDGLLSIDAAARAVSHGVTPAWVMFTSGSETTAGVIADSFDLYAGGTGAEVLWKPEGTGSLLSVVRIGGGNIGNFVLAQLTSALSAGGSATAEIWDWDASGTFANTNEEVTVIDKFMASGDDTITVGTLIGCERLASGRYIFTVAGCTE